MENDQCEGCEALQSQLEESIKESKLFIWQREAQKQYNRAEDLEKALWSARFAMHKVNTILESWDGGAEAWDIIADQFEGVSQEAYEEAEKKYGQ